jgi:REP element-mobilizing transposase RayT
MGHVVAGWPTLSIIFLRTPEHVHVLLSEPEKGDPSRVVQAIKQSFARHVAGGPG